MALPYVHKQIGVTMALTYVHQIGITMALPYVHKQIGITMALPYVNKVKGQETLRFLGPKV